MLIVGVRPVSIRKRVQWLGLSPHVELIPVVITNFSIGRYQLRRSLGLYN